MHTPGDPRAQLLSSGRREIFLQLPFNEQTHHDWPGMALLPPGTLVIPSGANFTFISLTELGTIRELEPYFRPLGNPSRARKGVL